MPELGIWWPEIKGNTGKGKGRVDPGLVFLRIPCDWEFCSSDKEAAGQSPCHSEDRRCLKAFIELLLEFLRVVEEPLVLSLDSKALLELSLLDGEVLEVRDLVFELDGSGAVMSISVKSLHVSRRSFEWLELAKPNDDPEDLTKRRKTEPAANTGTTGQCG